VAQRLGEDALTLGLGASLLFWVIVAPLWLRFRWRPKNALVLAATGWIVIFPTWFALIVHRPHEGEPFNLLLLMALVWVADIAAYFTGRTFGRHKLAPSVSPGKTWEGVAGALLGAVIYALLCFAAIRHFGIAENVGLTSAVPTVIAAFLILALLSIVGDLFESWMKRGAGLKDSSNLLPGHGGLLDRIDALTSTLPTAPFVLLAVQWLMR
jgi:phosphatidate cytidylyltransferase